MSTGLQPRWPDVYTALLALFPALPGFRGGPRGDVAVYDGQSVSDDQPIDFVTVGFQTDEGAGSFAQQWDPSGFGTVESGDLRCLIDSNSGDTDPLSVGADRARAFAMFAALQNAILTDQTLGGALTGSNVRIELAAQIISDQNTAGFAQSLLVTLTYQVTTYFT